MVWLFDVAIISGLHIKANPYCVLQHPCRKTSLCGGDVESSFGKTLSTFITALRSFRDEWCLTHLTPNLGIDLHQVLFLEVL